MTQLSDHFSLAEMCRTSTGFRNEPNAAQTCSLRLLCATILEPVRAHFGKPVKINSGYRGPKVNAAVGSKPTSQHAKGEAADIEIDGITNHALAVWIRDHLDFDQLILEAYRPGVPGSGWVHVSYKPTGNRRQVLTMTLGSHGPVYSQGIA